MTAPDLYASPLFGVAITCAALGVDAQELDLPVPLDRHAYRNAVALLSGRGLIERGRNPVDTTP